MTIHRLVWPLACLIGGMKIDAAMAGPLDQGDLRDLSVGMSIREIPADEYIDLACAAAPDRTLARWDEFAGCPADSTGLRSVVFRYNDKLNPLARINDKYQGTNVAGHPVILTLLIDGRGLVDAIRIDTDPRARPFWRKKAFLLGLMVKARFGDEGWACRDLQPADGEAPVGGVFIKEHCEKTGNQRRLMLDRELYRGAGQSMKDFVNETHVEIRRAAGPSVRP